MSNFDHVPPADPDAAYRALIDAEHTEQAALLMLGVRDDVAMRALYEEAMERVDRCAVDYERALDETRGMVLELPTAL